MRRRTDGIAKNIMATISLLATLVMLPRLLEPDFGLLDDGVSLVYGSRSIQQGLLRAAADVVQSDGARGRFHPVHWMYLILQFRFGKYNPLLWFSVNWLLLGATGILIARIVWLVSKDKLAAGCSGAGYLLFPSVFESYYTLSKSEPVLVFWLVTSVWLLFESIQQDGLRKRLLFELSCAFLCLAYYTKETALAMVVTTAIWAIFELNRSRHSKEHPTSYTMRLYFAANLLLFVSFFLARALFATATIATGGDSREYVVSVPTVLNSTLRYAGWYLRDYPHVVAPLGFLWFLKLYGNTKRKPFDWLLVISLSWIVGSMAVMLP